MSKARITYRFDQNGRAELKDERQHAEDASQMIEDTKTVPLFEGEYEVLSDTNETKAIDPKRDTQYLNQFTSDFGAWSSPFDAETEKLEQLIRSSEPNSRRSDKQASDMIYYDSIPSREQPVPRVVRYSKTPWSTVMTAFIGAVITGVVFGFFVLTFFNDNVPSPDLTVGSNPMIGAPPIVSIPDEVSSERAEGNQSQAEQQAVAVNLPAQTYYLLQNGVFASDEGAEMAIANLKTAGFNGTTVSGQEHYVYAGIVNDRDAALSLSHELQSQQFETYIKALEIPEVRHVSWNEATAERIEAYVKHSNDLTRSLINVSVLQLQKQVPSALEQSSMQSLKQVHQAVIDASAGLAEGLAAEQQTVFNKMNSALNTAVVSMEEYNRNPAHSYQWQVQAALTDFALLQDELLNQLSN